MCDFLKLTHSLIGDTGLEQRQLTQGRDGGDHIEGFIGVFCVWDFWPGQPRMACQMRQHAIAGSAIPKTKDL